MVERTQRAIQPSYEELAAENAQLRQRVTELEAAVAALQAENAALHARIAELEAVVKRTQTELQEAQRASKRQAAPFRRQERKEDPKPPGRKPGHEAALRPRPEKVDRTVEVKLAHADCPLCGSALTQHSTQVQYQVDIPPVQPVVTQFNIETAICSRCAQRYQAHHPEQISDALGAAEVQIGPRALALAAEMKHGLGVPYRKVAHVLEEALGLPLAPSTLARADQRLAEKAEPTYQKLISTMRQSPMVHIDETGWWVAGESSWLWVFTTDGLTIYAIRKRHSHEVVESILGEEFPGTIGCDCFQAYSSLDFRQQKDLVHLLRLADEVKQDKPAHAAAFAAQVTDLLKRALSVWKQREQMSSARYARARRCLEAELDQLLAADQEDPDNQRLVKLLRKHREQVFPFLYAEGIEPTNSAAEREIRPAVVVRKISAGNRSERGANAHAVLTSLLRTCQKQGRDFLQVIADLLHSRLPEAIDLLAAVAAQQGIAPGAGAAQASGP